MEDSRPGLKKAIQAFKTWLTSRAKDTDGELQEALVMLAQAIELLEREIETADFWTDLASALTVSMGKAMKESEKGSPAHTILREALLESGRKALLFRDGVDGPSKAPS